MLEYDAASSSAHKIKLIEEKWAQLLLNWVNRCASPKAKVKQLDTDALLNVIDKYKDDISEGELDKALLRAENLEPFIKYKYPLIKLKHFSQEKKRIPKKYYIMASVLLFHCCANSKTGAVDNDICSKMDNAEKEWILKYCETLCEMEFTMAKIELAIREAYDCVIKPLKQRTTDTSPRADKMTLETVKAVLSSTLDDTAKAPIPDFKTYLTPRSTAVETSLQTNCSDNTDYSQCRSFSFEELAKDISIYDMEDTSQQIVKKVEFAGECGPICPTIKKKDTCCNDSNLCTTFAKLKRSGRKFKETNPFLFNWKAYLCIVGIAIIALLILVLLLKPFMPTEKPATKKRAVPQIRLRAISSTPAWICEIGLCQKVYPIINETDVYYASLARCTLICMGPQLWPHPIGFTYFSKQIVSVSISQLEFKFEAVPSEPVREYLNEAFELFRKDLAALEGIESDFKSRRSANDSKKSKDTYKSNNTYDHISVKKMSMHIYIETDPDPRLRLSTDESYTIKVETMNRHVGINITAPSFCGVRHGLETFSQMILLDQTTGSLITVTTAIVKDAPSLNYRGLMIDTGRNYIPVDDLLRTIDAMATCKLNTFHWRITDVTSFPWYMSEFSPLFDHGAYDKNLRYTEQDIRSIVHRGGVRGVRVLMEVAVPGPVGRPWAWTPYATCPEKNENFTCSNVLCVRLNMQRSIYDILEKVYASIIDLTKVDDVFHLSNGIFSLSKCYYLFEDRLGFLQKALERLKRANKGALPKLPIVWYTTQMDGDWEKDTWYKKGVQLNEWVQNPGPGFLGNFRVIHSSRWDLSCEIKKYRCTRYRTWQEMYAWRAWHKLEAFCLVGGEAVLWTDFVNSGNLDYHIWPRAAAVAERLWSDMTANKTVTGHTYVRLDNHRWRMTLRGIKMPPIWPLHCSFSPAQCMQKLNETRHVNEKHLNQDKNLSGESD